MNYNELLNDYIDGSLLPEQEQELFALLNSSEELRNQMKNLIAVNMAAKHPMMQSRPSGELTRSLFSNLGVSVLPEDAEHLPGEEDSEETRRRFLPMIVSIAASLLILLFLTYSLDKNSLNNGNTNGNSYYASTENGTGKANSTPVIASRENGRTAHTETAPARDTVVKYVVVNRSRNDNESVTDSRDMTIDGNAGPLGQYLTVGNTTYAAGNSDLIGNWKPETVNPVNVKTVPPEFDPMIIADANRNAMIKKDDGRKLGLTVEFRGSQNWLVPEANIEPRNKALFNNNSLALLYSVTDELAVGGEVRQENFFQKYQGYDRLLATESVYEQQPNFTSGGVFLRYANCTVSFLNPFVQLTGGANETGFIARGMAGLIVKPLKDVSIIVGFEYSRLYYGYQGDNFLSDKRTLMYGLSYTF